MYWGWDKMVLQNMTGKFSGIGAKVKILGHILPTHCSIYRQQLVVKRMSTLLHEVL